MKDNLHNALVKAFIEKDDFAPVQAGDTSSDATAKIHSLIKSNNSKCVIIDIRDGDELSASQISERLLRLSQKMIETKEQISYYYYTIMLFDSSDTSEAYNEKLQALSDSELDDIYIMRFMKCISVVNDKKQVTKHYVHGNSEDNRILDTITQVLSLDTEATTNISELIEFASKKQDENTLKLAAKVPVFTYALIAINVAVAALLYYLSQESGTSYTQLLYDYGAKVNDKIIAGEYFRFVTPIFLHSGVMHLLVNCYSLYVVGINVELIYGKTKFLIVYMIAGIIGNIASFVFSTGWSVGASGAIFGLMGVLLYFGLEKPVLFKRFFGQSIIATIIINLIFGISTTGIDNFAHLGGMVGGFLGMGVIAKGDKTKWYLNRVIYIVLLIAIIISGLIYGFSSDQAEVNRKYSQMKKYEEAKEWNGVEKVAKEILQMAPKQQSIKEGVLWSLSQTEAFLGKYDQAIKYADELVGLEPTNGYFIRGWIHYSNKEYNLAKADLLKAKELGAEYEDIDTILKELE